MKDANAWWREYSRIYRGAIGPDEAKAAWGECLELIRDETRQKCVEVCVGPLIAALRGDKKYRLNGYVRWGLVEKDMKRAILNAGKENSP